MLRERLECSSAARTLLSRSTPIARRRKRLSPHPEKKRGRALCAWGSKHATHNVVVKKSTPLLGRQLCLKMTGY